MKSTPTTVSAAAKLTARRMRRLSGERRAVSLAKPSARRRADMSPSSSHASATSCAAGSLSVSLLVSSPGIESSPLVKMGRQLAIGRDQRGHVLRRAANPALYGGQRHPHTIGNLFELEPFHVPQDESRAVIDAKPFEEQVKSPQHLARFAVHTSHGQVGKLAGVGKPQDAAHASTA